MAASGASETAFLAVRFHRNRGRLVLSLRQASIDPFPKRGRRGLPPAWPGQ